MHYPCSGPRDFRFESVKLVMWTDAPEIYHNAPVDLSGRDVWAHCALHLICYVKQKKDKDPGFESE